MKLMASFIQIFHNSEDPHLYGTVTFMLIAHVQRKRGKVIGVGVHYVCMCLYACEQKKFESYFSDRLTFSNIRSSTSCRIYILALKLLSLETLSLLSNYKISF